MLPAILAALIPVLVTCAEQLFGGGGTGPTKQQWVVDLVGDIMPLIANKVPSWIQPEMSELQGLVIDALETAVDKMEAAGADAGGPNAPAPAIVKNSAESTGISVAIENAPPITPPDPE